MSRNFLLILSLYFDSNLENPCFLSNTLSFSDLFYLLQIMLREGLEMLKIFKNYPLDTTIFNDFKYYDKREKFMQEEKARLLFKGYNNPFFGGIELGLSEKLNCIVVSSKDDKPNKSTDPTGLLKMETCPANKGSSKPAITNSSIHSESPAKAEAGAGDNITSTLHIGSLAVGSRSAGLDPVSESSNDVPKSEKVDVFTVGSMPIKVKGFADPPGILTVGSIPLDPKALQLDKTGLSAKN